MIQNAAAYANNTNSGAFPGLGQTRNGLSSPIDGQQDRSINSTIGGRGNQQGGGKQSSSNSYTDGSLMHTASRTGFENTRGSLAGLQDVDLGVCVSCN
jgi:CCR4-NOT transcription complex subunit 2